MVMRPRHILAAAGILTAVTLGSWATLVTDRGEPPPQAAAPAARPAPVTTAPAAPAASKPSVPDVSGPRPCASRPARLPGGVGRISRIAGDFDGDHARDQLLAYAELDAGGQPSLWHVRIVLATGGTADLALDNTPDWIGSNGLVARQAVDANGDGRDEGFVTSTGGASNDAYNIFGLAGCQVRQVRVVGSGPLRFAVGASVGHAEGFDCQSTDRRGRSLLALWGIERTVDHPDGRSTYTWTKISYRWVGSLLVRQVGTTSGAFVAAPDDPLPTELTTRCGRWLLVTGSLRDREAAATWRPPLMSWCRPAAAWSSSVDCPGLDHGYGDEANERGEQRGSPGEAGQPGSMVLDAAAPELSGTRTMYVFASTEYGSTNSSDWPGSGPQGERTVDGSKLCPALLGHGGDRPGELRGRALLRTTSPTGSGAAQVT
jgi:hypothetical protein